MASSQADYIIEIVGNEIPVAPGSQIYEGFKSLQACDGKTYQSFRNLCGGAKGSSSRRFSPSAVLDKARELGFARLRPSTLGAIQESQKVKRDQPGIRRPKEIKKDAFMPRYWWVNQNQTYKSEVGGGYMWSPKTSKGGGFNQFYDNMIQVRPGDLVFSFANKQIKAVGIVSAPARSAEKPEEFGNAGNAWDNDGWLVPVDYDELVLHIKPKDHMKVLAPLLPKKYSPIRADGDGNQVYLAEIPAAMAEALLSLIGGQVDATLDQSQERVIQNRTDIGATEKYQLVRSRVGQGQYRKNLKQHEARCRITGITDDRFLIASHIKPWARSTDFEKLDGNNGLLLSPHIDRLFDRGYISFKDNSELMMSPSLPLEIAVAWGMAERTLTGKLNTEQAVYMDFHRKEIFKTTEP